MESNTKMTPKDFFLHLGVVATLYVSTIAFISFLFAIINSAFPDTSLGYYEMQSVRSSIAWSLSVFIIVYPVFVYLLFKTSTYLRVHTEKAAIAIRKWFIYLTIFLTAVTLIVDGIVLLTTFLQGEQLTLRFMLKVLTVIVVALTIFWFSIKDLNGRFIAQPQTLKRTVIGTTIGVFILLVVGFLQMGSPQHARLVLEDARRVNDLSFIQNEVVEYWRLTGILPASLEDVNDPVRYIQVPVDPTLQVAYDYRVINPLTFELCATFATAQTQEGQNTTPVKYDSFSGVESYFSHEVGRTCFTRTIDPARIPKGEQVR